MKKYVFIGICFLLFSLTVAQAETMYVREVEITLRKGPGNHRKIITMLPPGRMLESLEQEDGWTHVRLPDEKEGWVLNRYLTSKKPKEFDLEVLREERKMLSAQVASLLEENKNLKEKNRKLGSETAGSEETFDELSKAYETLKNESSDYLKIKAAHQKAVAQLAEQREKSENLEEELARIRRDQNLKWYLTRPAMKGFMYGAGVLFVGLMTGLFIAKRQSRRSSFL